MARDTSPIVKQSRREGYALHPKAHKIMARKSWHSRPTRKWPPERSQAMYSTTAARKAKSTPNVRPT